MRRFGTRLCAQRLRASGSQIVRQALELNRAGDYRRRAVLPERRNDISHYARRLDEGENVE